MESKKFVVLLVAVLAFAIVSIANVSAFALINSVEVNGVETKRLWGTQIVGQAGETLDIQVTFLALDDVSDVWIEADLSSYGDYSDRSERFDVIANRVYTRDLAVRVPSSIDPDEPLELEISVKSRNDGEGASRIIPLTAQRESYKLQILDVLSTNRVNAGETLALDIVLKNRGRHFAEDTFVKVRIPQLGIEERAYFGDLSAVDQPVIDDEPDRLDKEDTAERRILLQIPSNAKTGSYTVEIEASTTDSVANFTRRITIGGSGEEMSVISPVKSKTLKTGDSAEYTLTLINSGRNVRVAQVNIDAPTGLVVNADNPVVAVPAGSSQTVKLTASSTKAGVYDFTVLVQSNGETVSRESYVANVERSSATAPAQIGGSNTTVLLTVVLAIIFIVLLVVLIVLLTRKPEKREIGESYY